MVEALHLPRLQHPLVAAVEGVVRVPLIYQALLVALAVVAGKTLMLLVLAALELLVKVMRVALAIHHLHPDLAVVAAQALLVRLVRPPATAALVLLG